MIARLNIRHELPQLGIKETLGRIDEARIIQPRSRGRLRQPQSNMGTTQPPNIEMDSYPSRRAYGARKMGDFTYERGKKGFSDIDAATARHTRDTWTKINNGAKPGNDIVQNAKAELFSKYKATPVFTIIFPADVQVTGHTSKVVGEPDVGDFSVDVETTPSAQIHYTPGNVEIYMKNEGFLRQWLTMGSYDIYA
jgi:hypothetical protein